MVEILTEHYISSMPVRDLSSQLDRRPADDVVQAACNLKHRAFVIVRLILQRADLSPDHRVYVHNPDPEMGRPQDFGPLGRSASRVAAEKIQQQLIELLWPLHLG